MFPDHFRARVGALDGDVDFLINRLPVLVTHGDGERIGKRFPFYQMIHIGRVDVCTLAPFINFQGDFAVFGFQLFDEVAVLVAEEPLKRLGFSPCIPIAVERGVAIPIKDVVDVFSLQGSFHRLKPLFGVFLNLQAQVFGLAGNDGRVVGAPNGNGDRGVRHLAVEHDLEGFLHHLPGGEVLHRAFFAVFAVVQGIGILPGNGIDDEDAVFA